jgi:DNA-directed RNA polymerase subunit RPC12/RpoP
MVETSKIEFKCEVCGKTYTKIPFYLIGFHYSHSPKHMAGFYWTCSYCGHRNKLEEMLEDFVVVKEKYLEKLTKAIG